MAIAGQRLELPFIGGTKRSRSAQVNDQRTVGLMTAIKGEGAKARRVLETAPGIRDLNSIGDGACRTAQMVSSKIRGTLDLYGVFGTKLVAQTITTGNIEVGTLNTNPGRVEIAAGRNYIALVDGTDGYYYDGTNPFAQITAPAFPSGATHIRYIDGFFVTFDPATDNFFISGLEDPTTWNALDFEAAAVKPDAVNAIEVTESRLWVYGPESAQPYYNDGDPDFPYQLALSAVNDYGVLAPYSVRKSPEGIFYLATTPQGGRFIIHTAGDQAMVISGDEEEDLLQTVVDPEDAYAFIYKQAGKSFYCLQLGQTLGDDPRDSVTMIYNMKARAWESRELSDGSAWRVGGVGVLDNQLYAGSRLGARQLRLDLDYYQDSGQELIRLRRTQVFHTMEYLMDWWEIVIDVETGVGTGDGTANEDPYIQLRYWLDEEADWSAWLSEPLGKQGESFQRVVFHQLGQGRHRTFEIRCTAAVPLTLINAFARVEILEE